LLVNRDFGSMAAFSGFRVLGVKFSIEGC